MKTAHFLKSDRNSSQNLALGPLSYTTTYARKFKLEQIIIHFSQAVTETVTVTLISANGANYNTVLQSVVLAGETDFVYRPQGEANYQAGDEIKVQCTNANLIATAYLTIKTSEM